MKLNRPAIIGLVTACGTMSPTALQILMPALPYIRADYHTSIAQTQWLVTAFSIALAVSMLTFGPLTDRWGRRWLLLAGMAIFTMASGLAWLAPSLEVLIVARVVQAIGAGAASTISRTVAADLFAGEDLTQVLAYTTMGMVVGPLIAPIVAGFMADRIGWASIMLLLFGIGAIITVLAALGIPETRPAGGMGMGNGNPARHWGAMLANPGFRLYISILISTQVGVYAFISASPYLIVEVLHRSATAYGLFFVYITLGYLAGNFVAARFARRIGSQRAVFAGLVLFVVAWAVMATFVLAGHVSTVTLFGPATLMTMANGLIQPNCHAAAINLAGERKGTAASLTGFAQIMAGAAGFQIMAFANSDHGSPVAMITVIGAAALTCALLAVMIRQRFQRAQIL